MQNVTGRAVIDQSGLLTAQADGKVIVKATSNGTPSRSASVTVEITGQKVRVTSVSIRGKNGASSITEDNGKLSHISLPECEELFSPSLSVVALQLFSYYVAANKGLDIDKPRNLAKSVTVE